MTSRSRIAVIGAGLMGHGIAQAFAVRGHEVAVHDPAATVRAGVIERIRANLRALGQPESAVDRVTLHETLAAAVAGADVVFEAAPEKLDLKQAVFAALEPATHPECVLASNTSVIPIGSIGERVQNGGRVLGTHWWNPPYLIPLVEVVQAPRTEVRFVERCMTLLASIGKVPVHVRKDVPGFIGNRLQHALWREAIALVANGVCDAATVDLVVKSSFGMRLPVLGPLENADLVGLDLTLDVHAVLLQHLEASGAPSPLLEQYVNERRLGMKTGAGLYERWTDESANAVRAQLVAHLRQWLDRKAE